MPSPEVTTRRTAVYFPPTAYAGIGRRCIIVAVDLVVLAFLGLVWWSIFGEDTPAFGLPWLIIAYVYLVPVEAAVGTVGMLLTGTRIVDRNGRQPSIIRMTYRLLMCVFWLNSTCLLIDFGWPGADDFRQTLRDKIAGTYIVRRGVAPAAEGNVCLMTYFLFGFVLLVHEVRRSRKCAPVLPVS